MKSKQPSSDKHQV